MAKKTDQGAGRLTMLLVPRAMAFERLQKQIEEGRQIRERQIKSGEEIEKAWSDHYKWASFNRELLARLFDTDSETENYRISTNYGSGDSASIDLPGRTSRLRKEMNYHIDLLESVSNKLELIPESDRLQVPSARTKEVSPASKDVFIVHGHDVAARESVSRLLEKLNLNPVILSEESNEGRTIIEKIEDSSNVGFALVLLTSDDIGYPEDAPDKARPRARQNVILELGFFLAKLGRSKVCAIYQEGVEMPSDYHGVVYILLDSYGAWQIRLAKELKAAGLPIDLNRLV